MSSSYRNSYNAVLFASSAPACHVHYKQAQLVVIYLKKLCTIPEDGPMGLDGDFWMVRLVTKKDSPMRAYEGVSLLAVTIKIYSKKLEGFSIWISYDEDEGGSTGGDDDNVVGENDAAREICRQDADLGRRRQRVSTAGARTAEKRGENLSNELGEGTHRVVSTARFQKGRAQMMIMNTAERTSSR